MREAWLYQWLADGVLMLHFAVVVFVVGGLVLIIAGNLRKWQWVNGFRFRLLHGAAIAFVVAQAWLGAECPLTTLERWLRQQAQVPVHQQGFIEYWLQRILFFEAPGWVFVLVYTLFGLLVLVIWFCFPPSRRCRRK